MTFGGARYIVTGRGFATTRIYFNILFSRFAGPSWNEDLDYASLRHAHPMDAILNLLLDIHTSPLPSSPTLSLTIGKIVFSLTWDRRLTSLLGSS
jgi:hypothetical protein